MSYAIFFFGIRDTVFADRLKQSPDELVRAIRERLQGAGHFDESEIAVTVDEVKKIATGSTRVSRSDDPFDALCWIGDVLGEKIRITSFAQFRHTAFLDDVGLWPFFLRERPSFPIPQAHEPPPQIGFLPVRLMSEVLESGSQLPPPSYPEAAYARQELLEVIESLLEDELDLLAILK